jgi:hypothetical protein
MMTTATRRRRKTEGRKPCTAHGQAPDREREKRRGRVGHRLIGLAWTNVYETLDTVAPGSFRFPPMPSRETPGLLRYVYVPLPWPRWATATGPQPRPGRHTLAWLEAVNGQLYLAITVAQLVALSLAERARPDSTPAKLTATAWTPAPLTVTRAIVRLEPSAAIRAGPRAR